MTRPPATPAPAVLQQIISFTVLTVLFTLLHYMGSAV
jgi:hypothetical protein